MVKKIVELIGGTVVDQPDLHLYNSTKPIFTVPKQVNDNKSDLGITYHFQGSTTEDIVVWSRATWFISDENGDGLIWAREATPLVAKTTHAPLPPQGGVATFGIVRAVCCARFTMLICLPLELVQLPDCCDVRPSEGPLCPTQPAERG